MAICTYLGPLYLISWKLCHIKYSSWFLRRSHMVMAYVSLSSKTRHEIIQQIITMNYSLRIHLFRSKVSSVESVHGHVLCYCIITIKGRESMMTVRPCVKALASEHEGQCKLLGAQTVSFTVFTHTHSVHPHSIVCFVLKWMLQVYVFNQTWGHRKYF